MSHACMCATGAGRCGARGSVVGRRWIYKARGLEENGAGPSGAVVFSTIEVGEKHALGLQGLEIWR